MQSPLDRFEYVGFWRRVGVALLDCVVFSPLMAAYYWFDLLLLSFRLQSIWLHLLYFLAFYLPTLYFVTRFGGTPGKLMMGMRVVESSGQYLSLHRALRRDSIQYLSSTIHLLLLSQTIAALPNPVAVDSTAQVFEAFDRYGGWWNTADWVSGILPVMDVLVVCMNRRKRAIHDYIAGSYVITKRSYDRLHAPPEEPGLQMTGDALPAR
ncbi:MAG: RDD family protein [Acidobacteriota bacterium]